MELRYLERNGWLDRRTRGVFIELVLYSPPTNIFCDVFLFLARSPVSSFHFSSKLYAYRLGYGIVKWNFTHILLLLALIGVSVFMLVRECVSLSRLGCRNYPFNWFDGILVAVIILNAALYFGINALLKTVISLMYILDPKIFISFEFTTLLNSCVQFGLGLLVVLATIRCWRVLSFATHFQVVKTMLILAYQPLLSLVLYLMVVQLQFAMLFVLIMGGSQDSLHRLSDAFVLLLAYLVDYTADYEEFEDAYYYRDNALAFYSYWVFVGFMYFIFLNFFLGIVSMAFESAGEIVRQQETEGFSLSKLICDELRFTFKLPGGRLRKDSSLFDHIRKNFINQKQRIHGETLRVARAELGAMTMVYKLFTDQPVSEQEMHGAMTMIALTVATPMEERVNFPGASAEISIGRSWSGQELLDMHKLRTVMETLNRRSSDQNLALDEDQIASLRRLLREMLGQRPPSTLPLIVRVRRGAPFQRRPTFRIASLLVRRRRCVQIRFRLRRISAPPAKPRAPWRP
ncbi:hypothetical protein ONE63_007943 [Megalurothrips usitatus]|uniref:Uncharacterized protein n=1 Tax=Megalurothrips usitatus TaxID=439358 RepID=A0AAV7XP95_9NEOP|nr:hypothetical protein ONE63_007943 [Megalurothrips usitatus]